MRDTKPTVIKGTITDFDDHYGNFEVSLWVGNYGDGYDAGIGSFMTSIDTGAKSAEEAAKAVGCNVRVTVEVLDD